MLTPGNFTCKDAAELLDDYRRNSIEPHLRVMLSEHLAQCEECAGELQLREAMARHLHRALPASAPRAGLPVSVKRAISQMSNAGRESKSPQLLPWMLTAALAIGIGIAALQMRPATQLPVATDVASTRAMDYGVEREINQTYYESIATQEQELKKASQLREERVAGDAAAPAAVAAKAEEATVASRSAPSPAAAEAATMFSAQPASAPVPAQRRLSEPSEGPGLAMVAAATTATEASTSAPLSATSGTLSMTTATAASASTATATPAPGTP